MTRALALVGAVGLVMAVAGVVVRARQREADRIAMRAVDERALRAAGVGRYAPAPPRAEDPREAEERAAAERDRAETEARHAFEAMTPAEHLAAAQSGTWEQRMHHLGAIDGRAPEHREAVRQQRALQRSREASMEAQRRAVAAQLDDGLVRDGFEVQRTEARGRGGAVLFVEYVGCGRVFLDRFLARSGADLRALGFTSVQCSTGFTTWDQPL